MTFLDEISVEAQPVQAAVAGPAVAAGDPVEFARTRLGFVADEKQAVVLRSTANRGILNCSRQWGKSTVMAAKAVIHAYTQPGRFVLIASPSKRQSAELIRKIGDMVFRLGLKVKGDGTNACSIAFPNGSRIVGLPGKEATVRGFSAVSLLLIDEAARVDNAMYRALRPMLAVGNGDLWMMSTPNGKRGFFYEKWMMGGPEWHKVSAKATENPRISREFLEEERSEMGAGWYRQEYGCEFVEGRGTVFQREMIEAAIDEGVRPLEFGNW